MIRLVLAVCDGVGDVEVNAEANTVRVFPHRPDSLGARRPDPTNLVQHLERASLGVTFAWAIPVSSTAAHGGGGNPGGIALKPDVLVPTEGWNDSPPLDGEGMKVNGNSSHCMELPTLQPCLDIKQQQHHVPGDAAGERGPIVLNVEGMVHEQNCGSAVQKALEGVPGVSRAEVYFKDKRAKVWGTQELSTSVLISAVNAVHFRALAAVEGVSSVHFELTVDGMMCQKNCGTTVRKALEAVPGVSRAEVSHIPELGDHEHMSSCQSHESMFFGSLNRGEMHCLLMAHSDGITSSAIAFLAGDCFY